MWKKLVSLILILNMIVVPVYAADSFSGQTAKEDAAADAAYKEFLKTLSRENKENRTIYLEDMDGDGVREMMISEKGEHFDTFSVYYLAKDQVKKIRSIYSKADSDICTCIYRTENKKGKTGLLRLTITLDPKQAGKLVISILKAVKNGEDIPMSEIYAVIAEIGWRFETFSRKGKMTVSDSGIWKYGKSENRELDQLAEEYIGSELLLFRSGNAGIMDKLAFAGAELLIVDPRTEEDWFPET